MEAQALNEGGFIAGPDGAIDWAAPDEELMRFHNEQTRQLGARLCGRGLYQDMLPAPTLVELDLIDEYRLFVSPVVLGGGTRYFPALDSRLTLELVETRTFGARVVSLSLSLRYRRVCGWATAGRRRTTEGPRWGPSQRGPIRPPGSRSRKSGT
jgi:hypothetical protein